MNKKIMSRVFYTIAIVSLAIGAAFHGYRMQPEDAAMGNTEEYDKLLDEMFYDYNDNH